MFLSAVLACGPKVPAADTPADSAGPGYTAIQQVTAGMCAHMGGRDLLRCWSGSEKMRIDGWIQGVGDAWWADEIRACWLNADSSLVECSPEAPAGWPLGPFVEFRPVYDEWFVAVDAAGVAASSHAELEGQRGVVRTAAAAAELCVGRADGSWTCAPEIPPDPLLAFPVFDTDGVNFAAAGASQVHRWDGEAQSTSALPGGVVIEQVEVLSGGWCGITEQRRVTCQLDEAHGTWAGVAATLPDRAATEPVLDLDCGFAACCAVLDSGELECWGHPEDPLSRPPS